MSQLRCLLEHHAKRQPKKVVFAFVVDGERTEITFHDLLRDVLEAQRSDGPKTGALHFVRCDTRYEVIVTYLAAIVSGNHPAFLPPLTARMDEAIYREELSALMERFRPYRLTGFEPSWSNTPAEARSLGRGIGFVQFSSGTTGLRKGVFISEERLLAQVSALGDRLRITPDDRIASWLPLYHDMGLITSLFLPVITGCSTTFLDPVEWSYRPSSILEVIQQERSTLCWLPDFAFNHIVNWRSRSKDETRYDLTSIRTMTSCSEPCRKATFSTFVEVFEPMGLAETALQTSYAMAETVFAVSQTAFIDRTQWTNLGDGVLPSGSPLFSCEFRIRANDGVIQIKSPFLFDGYLNQEKAGLFDGEWYNSGDLGYFHNGQVHVLGRQDDTLIVNGKKILAHEVEAYAATVPGIKPGRLICTTNSEHSAISVFYEGEKLPPAHQQTLRKWVITSCGVSLDRLILLENGFIVKSSSGKLARTKTLDKLRTNKLLTL
jgi:acyl-CoA synthetase (AMP-forming)/AMP-acid ligase II